MGYQRGSDEVYRSRVSPGYDDTTIRLINNSAARNMDQGRELSNLYSSGIAEEGQHIGDTIGKLPGAFGQGMAMRQGYEQHGKQMRAADLAAEEQQYRNKVAGIEAGARGRQDEYMQGSEEAPSAGAAMQRNQAAASGGAPAGAVPPPVRTREQTLWSVPQQQANDQHAAAQQNIEMGKAQLAQIKDSAQRQKAQDMAMLYANTDPTQHGSLDAMAQKQGLTPFQVELAKKMGESMKKSAESGNNAYFNFSPQGMRFNADMQGIQDDQQALNDLRITQSELKNSWRLDPTSDAYKNATSRAQQILAARGIPYSPGLRSEHELEKAIAALEARTNSKLSYLRNSTARMSPEARDRVNMIQQADPNGFGAWSQAGQNGPAPGSGSTAIQNVLNKYQGGGQQQSAPRPYSPPPAPPAPPSMSEENMMRGIVTGSVQGKGGTAGPKMVSGYGSIPRGRGVNNAR